MAKAAKRSDTRTCQFEQRVPLDIASRANGLGIVIEFPATATTPARIVSIVIARDRVRFSLGTTDVATAAARNGQALAHVLGVFSAVRAGPSALSHKTTVALAGEVYKRFLDRHSDNPATPETWAAVKGFNRAVREGRIADGPLLSIGDVAGHPAAARALFGASLTAGIDARPVSSVTGLETRFGGLADFVLGLYGLTVDADSRSRLLVQVEAASTHVATVLKTYAAGDYSPDPKAGKYPAIDVALPMEVVAAPSKPTKKGVTWEQFVGLWARDHERRGGAATTRPEVIAFFKRFAKFVGKGPGAVTEDDVRRWRDKRLSEVSESTVDSKDMTRLRSTYRLAKEERLLTDNPAADVRVRLSHNSETEMNGHSPANVAAILAAATASPEAYRRWVPWLLAMTGSRASAVINLRSCDVKQIEGVWCYEVNREQSKAVKTTASCRLVPLHPALLEQGFVEFAKRMGKEVGTDRPLFYAHRPSRRGGAAYNPGAPRRNHLTKWVIGLGLPGIGRKLHRVDPLHGFRHWFKSAARKARIADSVSDVLSGHKTAGEAARYGRSGLDMPFLFEEVSKIAVPTLAQGADAPQLAEVLPA